MPRPVELSPEENERLRGVARDLARRLGTHGRAARLCGVTSGAWSYFLSRKSGASRQLRDRIDALNSDAGLERIHALNIARTLSTDDLRMVLAEREER